MADGRRPGESGGSEDGAFEEEEEEEEEEVAQEEKENVKLHALVSVFQFIMKQSYICALIAMMVSTGKKKK